MTGSGRRRQAGPQNHGTPNRPRIRIMPQSQAATSSGVQLNSLPHSNVSSKKMIMPLAVFGTTGAHLLELLGHELAECLWAVLVIAARSGVDLGAEFDACMELLG